MHRVYDSAVPVCHLRLTRQIVLPSPSYHEVGTPKW